MIPNKTLRLWKGNTARFEFAFKDAEGAPVDLTGSEMVFRAAWGGGGTLRLTSAGGGILFASAAEGRIVINLTVAQTRLIPTGSIARYELERRIDGTQTTLIWGAIEAGEGVNDDV